MNFYLWIVKAEQEGLFSSARGVSASYILSTTGKIDPQKLAGSIIFIVLRGIKGDVLFKKLYIKKIEEYTEDASNTIVGFLLTVDLLRSARISKNYMSGAKDYALGVSCPCHLGLSEITESDAGVIMDVLVSHIQSRFTIPSDKELLISEDSIPEKLDTIAFSVQLLKEMVKKYALESIWGSIKSLNPFANFSIQHLKRFPRDDKDKIVELLGKISADILTIASTPVVSRSFPLVDIDFEPIDTKLLYSRKFVAIDHDCDINATMIKTEDAERRHQEILRDVCEYFIQCGFMPEQSSSIDLALRKDSNYIIFEIKTTHPDNIVAQAGKGTFQLAMYSIGMMKAGLTTQRKILILESTCSQDFNEFIDKTVGTLGIEVLFYDAGKFWPNKFVPAYLH